jgi:hypothetical protein
MNAISNTFELKGPQAALERKYILEYLSSKGYTPKDLLKLSRNESRRLMTEASSYASLRLAEVESRALFLRKIEVAK